MSYKHIENYCVRTSEINHKRQIYPHALIQLMQEASMQHTIGMKVSMWDMKAIKSSWVLLKMDVRFYVYPYLNETVAIHTFPSGKEGYFTFRDYLAMDEKGSLYASASSQWTLMHLEERKMLRIPDEFGKLIFITPDTLPRPDFKIPPVNRADIRTSFDVNYFHLDWNGHVNNVLMFRLILESLDPEIFYSKTLKRLLIQFKSEAVLGQKLYIESQYEDEGHRIIHVVKNSETGKDIVLAETYWN